MQPDEGDAAAAAAPDGDHMGAHEDMAGPGDNDDDYMDMMHGNEVCQRLLLQDDRCREGSLKFVPWFCLVSGLILQKQSCDALRYQSLCLHGFELFVLAVCVKACNARWSSPECLAAPS